MEQKSGQLSRDDLIEELESGELIIKPIKPNVKDETKIKSASFDISPSCLIMSVKKGSFMRIYSRISRCPEGHRNPEWHCSACKKKNPKRSDCSEQLYTYIQPRDTVLVLSKEYLQIPAYMSGNVYSRVSTVSSGLGHISTTIDPLWKGALLIAISNPSSEPIKLLIQDEQAESIPLATVTLQYLNTPIEPNKIYCKHQPARVDILERYMYDPAQSKKRTELIRIFWHNFWHIKDYNLTVEIIKRLKEMTEIRPDEWEENLQELETEVRAQKIHHRWRYWLKDKARWLRKLILIVGLAVLAWALYCAIVEKSVSGSDFIGPLIIAIAECIIALILTQ